MAPENQPPREFINTGTVVKSGDVPSDSIAVIAARKIALENKTPVIITTTPPSASSGQN